MWLIYYTFFFYLMILEAHAVPAPGTHHRRAVKCDDISKYSTEYFMTLLRFPVLQDTCIFYTKFQGEAAKKFADGTFAWTIWDAFACEYYDNNEKNLDSPLHCIMGNPAEQKTYFENMSRAFARNCAGATYVMTDDINNIPIDGIWYRIEMPELQKPGGLATTITAGDPTWSDFRPIWERPTSKRESRALVARDNRCECFRDPGKIEEWYGHLGW